MGGGAAAATLGLGAIGVAAIGYLLGKKDRK